MEEETLLLEPFREKAEKGEIVEVSEIYALHRHGWRKVMPRSKHPKKASEEVIAASKK